MIVKDLQNNLQSEHDKITENILCYVQAAVTDHVISYHKLGGPTILELLQYR
jgi:hypothetical protein